MKPVLGHYTERDIPEKFLVTSKVVSMAPCSDRREGKKRRVMMMEGRREGRKEREEREESNGDARKKGKGRKEERKEKEDPLSGYSMKVEQSKTGT